VRGHVDSETLAAFREELLPRRKAGQVAAHLAHCEQCAGLDAQLADLPGLLAHTSAPPMPDALTARIEAALSAEAAARSALTPAGAATEAAGTAVGAAGAADAGATPTQPGDAAAGRGGQHGHRARRAWPGPGPGRSRLALRIAAAAAAIVVIGGGGYGVSRLVSGGGAGQASTASGAAAAAPEAKRPSASPAMGPAEHGAGRSGNKSRAASVNPSEPAMLSSGTNYRTGQLKTQVEAALASAGRTVPAPKPSHPVNGATALISCLNRVAGNQSPLLVDTARYNGRPATIIVLTTASAKTRRVVVVGPDCSATQTDLITTTTIPAPR
jgi:hypothetical protein